MAYDLASGAHPNDASYAQHAAHRGSVDDGDLAHATLAYLEHAARAD